MANTRTGNPVTPLPAKPRRCPICGKPAVPRHQPFCSARCANIDLGRWLKGNYSVPTDETPEDEPEGDER
ncbi:MAG TPA: DNA gyrase inhibitor YacG [Stellaceae bacterium]|jgi:hypothetical protein|nr:DNA gyrase inhibitor YacG [Stellaceae bacterium]